MVIQINGELREIVIFVKNVIFITFVIQKNRRRITDLLTGLHNNYLMEPLDRKRH